VESGCGQDKDGRLQPLQRLPHDRGFSCASWGASGTIAEFTGTSILSGQSQGVRLQYLTCAAAIGNRPARSASWRRPGQGRSISSIPGGHVLTLDWPEGSCGPIGNDYPFIRSFRISERDLPSATKSRCQMSRYDPLASPSDWVAERPRSDRWRGSGRSWTEIGRNLQLLSDPNCFESE